MKKIIKFILVVIITVTAFNVSKIQKQSHADIINYPINAYQTYQPQLTDVEITNIESTNTIIAQKTIVSRGLSFDIRITDSLIKNTKPLKMKATAYDLSVESCGKPRHHPQYGITASGVRAKPDRTVAVDPKVIPLGSILYIEFPEEYQNMNGLYVAEDTGSAIKGNRIDIFLGEDKPGERKIYNECLKFGIREVFVYVIRHKY
jgi:3D (Asp-Asp-Asp) domain-containing protein